MKTCDVTGCTASFYGSDLCHKHYMRRRRMGVEHFERFGRWNTPAEKFWLRVDRSGECWTWLRALNLDGYGTFQSDRTTWTAHRYSFTLANGPIPEGKDIDHRCRNRACVRPDHLRPVTNKQNSENQDGATVRSKTGVRGVHPVRNKYRVAVGHNGRLHHGGYYTDLTEAAEAARQLRLSLFTHNDVDRKSDASNAA